MADDFDQRWSELIEGENRLGDLFRQVSSSLDGLVDKARRLGDALDTVAPLGRNIGSAAAARAGANPDGASPGPGGAPSSLPAALRNPFASREEDRTALDNARANQRTAQAVEELTRNGIKLRETPPAVYGE